MLENRQTFALGILYPFLVLSLREPCTFTEYAHLEHKTRGRRREAEHYVIFREHYVVYTLCGLILVCEEDMITLKSVITSSERTNETA